jgi:hypothetical protein
LLSAVFEGQPARKEELGMAKRKRVLPAKQPRDRSRDDDSMLLRSAESLGRVIGALQRQLDSATKRLTQSASAKSARKKTSTPRKRVVRKRTRRR